MPLPGVRETHQLQGHLDLIGGLLIPLSQIIEKMSRGEDWSVPRGPSRLDLHDVDHELTEAATPFCLMGHHGDGGRPGFMEELRRTPDRILGPFY